MVARSNRFFSNMQSSPGSARPLKRSLPRFVSPLLSAKKSRLETDSHVSIAQAGSVGACDQLGMAGGSGGPSEPACDKGADEVQFEMEHAELTKTLEEKKEKLRKLKLVQLYRSKVERCMFCP